MEPARLLIVVPCYNEELRLPVAEFRSFLLGHPEVSVCFVDDASTDRTGAVLESLRDEFPGQIHLVPNPKNAGKAESVRTGVLYGYRENLAPALAYLDADLATTLDECASLVRYLDAGKQFVFASRILRVGSVVERKFARFFIGRVIATGISNSLRLGVYDTQCGCKVFRRDLAPVLFGEGFISRWLFDVELISRMLVQFGPVAGVAAMEEVPVLRWVDPGDSKVRLSYFFTLWQDLWQIRRRHRSAMRRWC